MKKDRYEGLSLSIVTIYLTLGMYIGRPNICSLFTKCKFLSRVLFFIGPCLHKMISYNTQADTFKNVVFGSAIFVKLNTI